MEYILMDCNDGVVYAEEFATASEAVAAAEDEWSRLSEHDKKRREAYYVIASVNPDEDAEDHYDGNIVKEWI